MDYIDRLKRARKQKHMRQIDVSTALGISRSTYCMYELRKNKMEREIPKAVLTSPARRYPQSDARV